MAGRSLGMRHPSPRSGLPDWSQGMERERWQCSVSVAAGLVRAFAGSAKCRRGGERCPAGRTDSPASRITHGLGNGLGHQARWCLTGHNQDPEDVLNTL
ncbi:MAG: hypothetical protein AN484_25535 [Aphanizomenon flos-aquae WA102]|uniref:Uncharacterized protein n=1 Tax=Aphanizomenon flos-aquae WA102 TaxID=1710896 RepID=A0A1B7WHJ6_APHFL|nr:MAG: hypothetical protein AN484_25535 [Aphanizomenon flos-aquae WA102]